MMTHVIALVDQTLRQPRAAGQTILKLNLGPFVSALCLLGTVGISVVMFFLIMMGQGSGAGMMPIGPIALAVSLTGVTALFAIALTVCGLPFRGAGRVDQAIVLLAWLQAMLIGFQVLQLAIGLVSVQAAGVFGILVGVFVIWLLLNFTAALHELPSLGAAVVVVLLAVVGLALAFSFLINLSGFGGQSTTIWRSV